MRSDVYARAPRGLAGVVQEEVGEMRLHFVGKVVAEGSAEAPAAATQAAALAAQEVLVSPSSGLAPTPTRPFTLSRALTQVLVKEHARLLTPDIFSTLSDEQMELWLAPGNSEMAVAQNAISMKRWDLVALNLGLALALSLPRTPHPHPLSLIPRGAPTCIVPTLPLALIPTRTLTRPLSPSSGGSSHRLRARSESSCPPPARAASSQRHRRRSTWGPRR